MRRRKLIIIIVLLGVIFIPFMSRASIRPVLAEENEPPTETNQDGRGQEVLTVDNLFEYQSDRTPAETEVTESVDLSLGMDPADFTLDTHEYPGFDGGNQGAPLTTNELGNSIESLNYNPVSGMNLLDNFNRPDGALGTDWTVHNGGFSIIGELVVGGSSGMATYDGYSGNGDTAEADVIVNGPGMQYTGLLLNYGGGVSNLFIKVQQNANSGMFDHAACYTGNQGPSFGLGYFTLDSPFYSAHMKATRVGDTVTLVFSNIDSGTQPSQTYICDGAPPREGSGVGIVGWSGIAYIDNFAVRGGCEWDMHDNGPMVTHEGAGYDGADVSVLQENAFGMNTLGWGSQFLAGNRLADDFVVTDPGGWQVNGITVPAFQLGSTTTPTINGLYFQIWDGPPDNAGSNVVFGDHITNRLISTVWTGIYRTTDGYLSDSNWPIMAATASVGVFLPPGTYWLDWMIDGSLANGPWVPPVTILGQTTTGNAMQYVTGWAPVLDTGTSTQQGFPFLIHGCKDDVLWDQPL